MRKFLLIAIVFLAAQAFAQKDYQFRVSSFMSEDALFMNTYNYAEPTGTDLRSINKVDFIDPSFQYEGIDSLSYDENGNITRLATYQLLNGNFKLVCFCDYTYNELGLRETRKNYNVWDDEIPTTPDGIITYFYDDDNKLIREEQFFFGAVDQITEYTYNQNSMVETIIIKRDPNWPPTGSFYENSSKKEFFYNEDNYLVETHDFTWGETGAWDMQSIEVRDYDDLGNCTAVTTTTPAGTPQVKYVYKYDEKTLAEDIFFYPNPEGDFPDYPQMHNMLTSYEFWAADDNGGGGLNYVIDYLLNYEQIGEIGLTVTANAEQDTICLNESLNLSVEVYGGTGDYTYSWTPAELLDDAESQNPVATPTEAGEVTFTVTVDDGLETVEASVTVFVKDCISVEENILNNVSIYPNPAEDFIMINSENVEFAEVIDIYGRVITASEINGETRIDMSNFANGIYYVRLHRNGETAVQKVVKN